MEYRLRKLLDEKKPILATRISSAWPLPVEVVGKSGKYNYIEFLAEYAPYTQFDLENICRATELHKLGSIIKVDFENRAYVAQKALSSGFEGILFTDHTTAEEVRESIRSIRPATPEFNGKMGYVNRRWIGNEIFASQTEFAEQVSQVVCGFMIEKKAAVENIEEICQVPGVDFIQFGPADFSMNSGLNAKIDVALVKEAESKVIKTALKYGVSPRVEITSASEAKYYMDMGVTHFALGTELRILRNYWTDEGDILKTFLEGESV